MTLKGLSIRQPYATAIALGIKTIVLRPTPTAYRGMIVIHASKHWTREQIRFAEVEHTNGRIPGRIPLGALIGFARLVDVAPVAELAPYVGALDRIYGDFNGTGYGWIVSNAMPLEEPIPYAGRHGLFEITPDTFKGATITVQTRSIG